MGTLDHGRLASCFYTIGNDAKRAFLDFDRPVRIYLYFLIIIMKTEWELNWKLIWIENWFESNEEKANTVGFSKVDHHITKANPKNGVVYHSGI